MPARIVVVHDDLTILEPLVTALRTEGYDVSAFDDSMLAWDALEAAKKVEVLITRIQFAPGRPHGVALAQRVRANRPGAHVVLTAGPELRHYADDLGMFLPSRVEVPAVMAAVERLLAADLAA